MKKTGKEKIARIAVLICVTVLGTHGPAWAGGVFKFGGGVFLDDNIPGINAAIDLPIREGIGSVSIFSDVFSKSTTKIIAGGVNVLKKKDRRQPARTFLYTSEGEAESDASKSQYCLPLPPRSRRWPTRSSGWSTPSERRQWYSDRSNG